MNNQQSLENQDQTANIAMSSHPEEQHVRIESLQIEGEVFQQIFHPNHHNVSHQHSSLNIHDQQSIHLHHVDQSQIPVATAITVVDDCITPLTKLWVVSIGKNAHKNFTEVAIKGNTWSHANLQDRNDIKKDDFVLFAVRLFRNGASQGFNRSQVECYGRLKQLMLVRITKVSDDIKNLDVYKYSTGTCNRYPFGYHFQIEWMENDAEFTAEKYGKQILEARRRSDIGGGIVIRADVDHIAIVNLRHKKELENLQSAQQMIELSSPSNLGKRSISLMENDAAGEAILNSNSDFVNSPDKKRQKKLRPDIEITEPVQLPVRLRLVNKGIEFWCTLELVDADQEVKSILLESVDGSPPSRFPNLSAAAKHVTGLETANGWKKWYYNYKGKWLPVGIFRRPGATPRLSHEFKDVRIKPRGKGFVNQGQVSSSPIPDGYQSSSIEEQNFSIMSAHQTAGYPSENYVTTKTVLEEQSQVIKCILIVGEKKKMLFLPFDKFIGDLVHHLRDEFGDGISIVVDGYEVDQSTKLIHIAIPDDGTGRPVVKAEVKMKTHHSHHSHHTSLSSLTQAMQEIQHTREIQNLPLSQAI